MKSIPVSFRLFDPHTDYNWVHKSWLSSERFLGSNSLVPRKLYNDAANNRIKYLLKHAVTMVAYLEDEPNVLLSFINYQIEEDNLVIHYSFTKSDFRCQGICKELVKTINVLDLPIVITCIPNPYWYNILHEDGKLCKALYDCAYFTRGFYGSK